MKKLRIRCLFVREGNDLDFKKMKLTFLFSFFVFLTSWGHSYSQQTRLSLQMKDVKVQKVLLQIEKQTDFYFLYQDNIFRPDQTVSIQSSDETIESILDQLAGQTSISYEIADRQIILKEKVEDKPGTVQQAKKNVTGIVTDDNGQPIPGVSVVAKGTTMGTVTDMDGKFKLEIPNTASSLQFSFVGMKTQEIAIDGKIQFLVVMEEDAIGIEEVIAVGYGTMRKSDLTGSIAVIGQDEYKEQPVNRVDQILQGRTAGVNVINSSGAPGGTSSIRIRGANSINGNNDPLYVIDGFVGANFRDVNPADIETIQVLKDASSTAIYGSRGANGVVLITTKSGVAGKPQLSVTARYITSKILNTWDLMDAASFAEVVNTRASALGTSAPFTSAEIADSKKTGGTDWQNELLRTGNGQEFQLDYSGGNDKVTYFISGNYLGQDGILVNSGYKRYSLRTNINAKITKRLKANLKMSFARRENNNTVGNGDTSGPFAGALAWAPTTPVRDESGALTLRDPISSIKGNPLELALNDHIVENNVLNANGGFVYELMEGLTLDVGFGLSYGNTQQKNFSAGSISKNASALRQSIERIFLQNTNTLTYTKVINGIHRITATGVIEHQFLQSDRFTVRAGKLQFPDLRFNNISLAKSISADAMKTKQTIRSYIGRVNYSLMGKYLVTVSVRSDGSSKFRGDNRYSTFPSVGLGWRLSEEPFVKELGFFDNLKLRASWGQTGSQGIPVYGTVTTFYTSDKKAGASFKNGQLTPGIMIGNPGNSNLRWETTEQKNVGLDMIILNERLSLEVDYFKKNTTDLLLSEPLPKYSGGGSIFRNLGEIQNTGFEFTLKGIVVDNGEFNWTSSFNASFLSNEVIDIGDREKIFLDGNAGKGMTNLPEMVIMPGYSLSNYWGLNYLGVWQTNEAAEAAKFGNVPGDSRYEDLNKDGVIGGDDYQIIGTGIPTRIFGWNNTIVYKDFTLNVFFQSIMGFDKWNFTYAQAITASADAREITHVDIIKRWAPGNENSNIPAFSATDVAEIQSSRFVEKGDYVRLKNVSLSYRLPKDFIKGINGSVMISGNNLWTLTNYSGIDPETYSNKGPSDVRGVDAGSYPNAKTWTIGVNLIF